MFATHPTDGRSLFSQPGPVDASAQGRLMVKLPQCWPFACRAFVNQNALLVRVTHLCLTSTPVIYVGASQICIGMAYGLESHFAGSDSQIKLELNGQPRGCLAQNSREASNAAIRFTAGLTALTWPVNIALQRASHGAYNVACDKGGTEQSRLLSR